MNRNKKIQVLQALDEIERRKRLYPLQYFKPHAKQADFIQSLKDTRIVLFGGGNRSGKTVMCAVAALSYAYGYWIPEALQDPAVTCPDSGDYPRREDVPPKYWIRRADGLPLRAQRSILIVTGLSLLKGIGNIIWPELENWLPGGVKFKVSRGALSVPIKLAHPDGDWTISFGSVEQGSMAFEGAKHDAVGFDEPPHRPVYNSCWRGLIDFFGSAWMTFTPLGNHAPWIYEEFYTSDREDVAIIEVNQKENPYVSEEALTAFEQGVQFNEEELLARQSGKFGFLTYRAFPSYDPDKHLIEPFKIPSSWPRVCACDPASRRPFYFLWLAFDKVNDTFVAYREFPYEKEHYKFRNSEWTIRDYARILRNTEGTERIDARVIDPRFGVAEYTIKGQKTTSVVTDFAEYDIHFDPRVPDTAREEAGIQRIRDLLWFDSRMPIGPQNRPRLVIFNNLKSLPHALSNYSFIPPDARDDRIIKDKASEFAKDPIDTLRYAILYGEPGRCDRAPTSYISEHDLEQENNYGDDWLV